ncbi:hypothetical protein [Streptomyces sp. NPDC001642]
MSADRENPDDTDVTPLLDATITLEPTYGSPTRTVTGSVRSGPVSART